MSNWFSRPVLFVASVERAIEFYVQKLGFSEASAMRKPASRWWRASREDCALLLNSQQPARNGHGRMFISLDQAALDALRDEWVARGAPVETGWWGYELMVVRDPDGNELFFPHPGAG